MKTFRELFEDAVTPNLTRTYPKPAGEQRFWDKHTVSDVLAKLRVDKDSAPWAAANVKTFNRSKNHFGNDLVQTIKAYENVTEGHPIGKIKRPGALTKRANKAGEGVQAFAKAHYHDKGLTGKEARFAVIAKKWHHEEVEPCGILKRLYEKRHIFINGQYAGTSSRSNNKKEALRRFIETHPGSHMSKANVKREGSLEDFITAKLNARAALTKAEVSKLTGIDEKLHYAVMIKESWGKLSHNAKDLVLHADNDSDLTFNSARSIRQHGQRKFDKGAYMPDKAHDMWKYHADRAAQSYHKSHAHMGPDGDKWTEMFPASTRREAASYWQNKHHENMKMGVNENFARDRQGAAIKGDLKQTDIIDKKSDRKVPDKFKTFLDKMRNKK